MLVLFFGTGDEDPPFRYAKLERVPEIKRVLYHKGFSHQWEVVYRRWVEDDRGVVTYVKVFVDKLPRYSNLEDVTPLGEAF